VTARVRACGGRPVAALWGLAVAALGGACLWLAADLLPPVEGSWLDPVHAAKAFDERAVMYGVTGLPLWEVGNHDQDLSKLCRYGRFNQKRVDETYILFVGPEGRGLLGIAKRGYNLTDPTRAAEPGKTYHFHQDRTSRCRVYVAP